MERRGPETGDEDDAGAGSVAAPTGTADTTAGNDSPPPRATQAAWESPAAGVAALGLGLSVCLVVWLRYGVERWFIADDWSYLLYRDVFDRTGTWSDRLFVSMNGHPVAVPAVVLSLVAELFGWSSYTPFTALAIVLWTLCCIVVFALLRHGGVSPLTSATVTVAAAATGAATEVPTMASIANFELSVLMALLALLVVERRADSRGIWGAIAALGVASTLSSALGPILMVAPAASALWQRRSITALVSVGPATAVFGWWWLAYGRDRASGSPSWPDVPAFVVAVTTRTFDAFVGSWFGVVAVVACVALGVVGPTVESRRVGRSLAIAAFLATVVIGWRRAALGTSDVEIGRYVAVTALLVAPLVAVAIDRLRSIARPVWLVALLVLVVATIGNLRHWRDGQVFIAEANRVDRATLELLAASDLSDVDPQFRPSWCSVEVQVRHLADLVELGVLEPRRPADDDERRLLEATLTAATGAPPAIDPRPCAG